GLPLGAARRMARRRAARGATRLHGRDRRAAHAGRDHGRDGVDREPARAQPARAGRVAAGRAADPVRRCAVSRARKWPLVAAAAVVLALGSWLARPDLIESDAPVAQLEATPELIAKGEYLARAGNCIGCHTVPGREPYSGGRRIPTPFGDVFTSNLTPDPETGIGEWSSADFWRAMHYGKSRDGRRLYPAFPYPSY